MRKILTTEAEESFNILRAGKFLATQNEDVKVNVVPIVSMKAFDSKTLVFGNIMMRKSKQNLEEDKRVSACVITEKPECYKVEGKFKGFENRGKHYEEISNLDMVKYSGYGTLRSVGIIKVNETETPLKRPRLNAILGEMSTRFVQLISENTEEKGKMHPNVMKKFGELWGAKVIASNKNGHPKTIPVLSMKALNPNTLIFSSMGSPALSQLEEGEFVASSILTMDAVSYQVKGVFEGLEGKIGKISVEEVYSNSPPRPGEKIN